MAVNPIPATYNRACPYLICDNAAQVLDFILKTFDAEDRGTMVQEPMVPLAMRRSKLAIR